MSRQRRALRARQADRAERRVIRREIARGRLMDASHKVRLDRVEGRHRYE